MTPVTPQMDREAFVGAMRFVASSVTVVTTDGPAGRHGATVSAFNSLSADPPSVLICLKASSRIARAVTENGRYCVNVLPEDQAEIAGRFAGAHDAQCKDRFEGVALSSSESVCPEVLHATSFHCEVSNTVTHGSHLILVGQVTAISNNSNPPLTYMDGRFHRVIPSQTNL